MTISDDPDVEEDTDDEDNVEVKMKVKYEPGDDRKRGGDDDELTNYQI